MERKLKIFLFSTILVLFLVGLYFVNATISIDNGASTIVSSGEAHETKNITQLANWTMGGLSEWFNFTINSTWVTNQEGINKTNITIPGGYSMNNLEANAGVNNGTSQNWTTMNNTITRTVAYSLSLGGNNVTGLIGPINFSMNLTAITGVEEIYTFNITSWGNQSNISSKLISMGVDGLAPRASDVNATDGTHIRSTGFDTSTYVKNDSNLVVKMTVTDYNIWRVILLYNNTGGMVNLTDIGDGSKMAPFASATGIAPAGHNAVFTEMTNGSAISTEGVGSSAPIYVYSITLDKGNYSSSGTPITFAFLVYDLYNQSKQVNNSNAVYRIVEDGTNPTVAVTAPSSTNIVAGSTVGITYTCAGTDENGTISSYEWTLTKPGGGIVTKTTASATFSGADIDYIGTYSAVCKVTDQVGKTATSSAYAFSAYISASGTGSSGGSSGTGTAGAGVKVDADLSVVAETTISKQQGRIVTFSLDGQNSHKMTFKEVTSNKVTLIIESTPIEVTLTVGETKKIDVDGDGTDDLELTLEAIENGSAKVKTKKIAETTLETTTTTIAGEEATTTTTLAWIGGGEAAKKSSLAWLWVLIIIIVIAVVVWVVSKKKRR